MKKMTLFAAIASVGLAALALAGPSNLTPSVVQFGAIPFGASSTALLDGGPVTSSWVAAPNNYVLSVTCTTQDAGSNAALGCITLQGSNTASATTSAALGTTQCFPAPAGTIAFDPISTGLQFLAVTLDGGGTVAGSVTCTINGRGGNVAQ